MRKRYKFYIFIADTVVLFSLSAVGFVEEENAVQPAEAADDLEGGNNGFRN